MKLEQLADFLENPSLLEHLATPESRTLHLKGLFYELTFNVPDADSIPFARSFLWQNPTSSYANDFISFLLHKNEVGNAEANATLFDFLLNHPSPGWNQILADNAVAALSPQHSTLFALYQNDRERFLQADDPFKTLTDFFIAAKPPLRDTLIQKAETNQLHNWLLAARAALSESPDQHAQLISNFEKFSDSEKTQTAHFLAAMIEDHPHIPDIFFQLFNHYQDDAISSLILAHDLRPSDPSLYALYLLFTHQWQAANTFDFDNTHLKNAFLKASPQQRQKILTESRKSGKFEWLHELSDFKKTKWVSDLNESDWENILNRLLTEKNEVDLLRILKIVPPIQAKTIIHTIQSSAQNAFAFSNDQDWQTLSALVHRLPAQLPPPFEINHTQTLANPVLSSEIQNNPTTVLLGTPTQLIHRFALENLKPILPALVSPAPQIRQMLLTPDQNYLILAHGDHHIRVLRLQDHQVIKTFSGPAGYIKKLLLSPDQKTLYATGFDGKLIAWRFPLGPMLQSQPISNQECFAMQFSAGQKSGLIADAQGMISIFDPISLKTIRKFQAADSSITTLAASTKTSQIGVYDTAEALSVWHLESGQQICASHRIPSPVTTLAYSDHDDFLIAGHLSGALTFYSSTTLQPLTSRCLHDQPLIDFHKLDHHRLLLVFRDGYLSIVDFLLLNTLYTPINLIKSEINFSEPTSLWADFITAFYRFIHRFDILIDEQASIQVGAYDIQIE